MSANRLHKEEQEQGGAAGVAEDLDTKRNPPQKDGKIRIGEPAPTKKKEGIEDPEIVDEDEEALEDEEEEAAEDAGTSGA